MEPLSALSLAVNIIQVIDFSAKVIDTAAGIYRSASGTTHGDQSLEDVVKEMQSLSYRLITPTTAPESEDEKALRRLAGECRSLSDQILELLDKIRPEDPRSKRQASVSALRHIWTTRERNELEMRLESCRKQLHLQLSFITSTDTRARLMGLETSATDQHKQLEQLQDKLESLRNATHTASLGDEAQHQIQSLLKIPDAVRTELMQQHIRKSLAFPEMRTRLDGIEEAHEKTFRWILDGGEIGEDRRQCHELFTGWLSKGDGIFHISGKLGSGKSTLMKFLCDDEATRAQLATWAGDKKLVFANFFFWKSGSTLQSSLIGMMRSFLHDILEACPSIAYTLFTKEWGSLATTSLEYSAEEIRFRDKDIRHAFDKFVQNTTIFRTHRFCFFIDGLDEYEETRQISKKHAVDLIKSWVSASNGGVKLCVSSREENVFLNAFSTNERLRLQDLTKEDMRKYVREMLTSLDETDGIQDAEKEELKESMIQNSNGIFLWLALVVKEIGDRVQDDPTISFKDLKRALEELPRELETLFEHLLASIPKVDRPLSYRLFHLVSYPDMLMSLLACSFLDDYEADPDFITRNSFPSSMSQIAMEAQLGLGRTRINRRCRGLVEVREGREKVSLLAFTHRSVRDFLEKPDVQEESRKYLGDFCREAAFLQLLLAHVKAIDRNNPDNWRGTITRVDFLLEYSQKYWDIEKVGRIEELENVNMVICEKYTPAERSLYLEPYHKQRLPIPTLFWNAGINNVMLFDCAMRGDLDYVEWKISQHPLPLNFEEGCMLLSVLREGACDDWIPLTDEDVPWRIAIMILLLESSNWNWGWHFRKNALYESDLRPARFWMYFICYAIYSYSVVTRTDSLFGELIAAFVNKGADPRLQIDKSEIMGQNDNDACKLVPVLPYVDIGEDAWWEDRFRIIQSERSNPVQKHILQAARPVSLRDIIEMWNFSSKAELLSLIDDRIRKLEEAENSSIYLEANSLLAPDVNLAKDSYILQPYPIPDSSKLQTTLTSHNPYFPPLESVSKQAQPKGILNLPFIGMNTGRKRSQRTHTKQDTKHEQIEQGSSGVLGKMTDDSEPFTTAASDSNFAGPLGPEVLHPSKDDTQESSTRTINLGEARSQRLKPLMYIIIGVLLTLMFDQMQTYFRG